MSTTDLPERWRRLWPKLGVLPPPGCYEPLVDAWREPHRRYHTIEHLQECLVNFEVVESLAEAPGEVEAAIWYHDAVYEIGVDTNELKSAYLAERAMTLAGCPKDAIGRVRNMILATRHHGRPETPDEALLLDIDLAILGAPIARYDRFETDIREEYHAIPWTKYVTARRQILRGFHDRPRLFHTPHFHAQLDAAAHTNLSRSLKRLRPVRWPAA